VSEKPFSSRVLKKTKPMGNVEIDKRIDRGISSHDYES
jgi:hypothetical protein